MIGLAAVIAAVALAAGAAIATAGRSTDVRTELDSYKEVPTLSTTGEGRFEAEIRGDSVRYELSYGDLEGGDVLFAHIHLGRPATIGGVVAFLCGGGDKPACPNSGTVEGVITADDVVGPEDQGIAPGEFRELVRAMKRRATYVNVHTDTYPTGEIRGNIIR